MQLTFSRGNHLAAEQNIDYAHELFTQCVLQDAGNLSFVQTTLTNLRTKCGGEPREGRKRTSQGRRSTLGNSVDALLLLQESNRIQVRGFGEAG
ncbi:MAG: hypothetical protein WD468_11075 [Pirellulales bacterium]